MYLPWTRATWAKGASATFRRRMEHVKGTCWRNGIPIWERTPCRRVAGRAKGGGSSTSTLAPAKTATAKSRGASCTGAGTCRTCEAATGAVFLITTRTRTRASRAARTGSGLKGIGSASGVALWKASTRLPCFTRALACRRGRRRSRGGVRTNISCVNQSTRATHIINESFLRVRQRARSMRCCRRRPGRVRPSAKLRNV
mmetsp:Transcript_16319/g.51030  ORF Transcript_16319/g.51030 Transcript_16319/m.51030 type:complete len:200 (-) Transcript_16319:2775-3374(-)